MANLTYEKAEFAIAIFRHFSPLFAIIRHWPPPPCRGERPRGERTEVEVGDIESYESEGELV